ncbi:MAG: hypothetical protein G8D91_20010 [gamma proteobacterium symbiont of Clathrolucina costata]
MFTNDGILNELVIAINEQQAKSFFTGEFHRDNLKTEFIGALPGMSYEQWKIEMKSLLNECGNIRGKR